jgi:hypothetical protein
MLYIFPKVPRCYMSKLRQLKQKVKDKIQQAKYDMHPTHNRAYMENLKIEIETLNWILNEILVVSRLA